MEIKPIKTEKDYTNSIKRIETLWGAKKDSIEGDELDLLCTLVESYEMHHSAGSAMRNVPSSKRG